MSAVAVKTSRKFDMHGKGSPRDSIPGLIGATKYDPFAKSLGGLVRDSKVHGGNKPVMSEKAAEKHNTERHILGPASKTKTPGAHFGQILYPGHFASVLGSRL